MKLYRALLCVFLIMASAQTALANLKSTRPDKQTIAAATAECKRGTAPIPKGIVGISDPHAADRDVINLIAETGVSWVRAEFYWSEIEPVPGAGYRWSKYDLMVRGYAKAGITVSGIMTYIPKSQPRDWKAIDANFQSFANALVQRYRQMGVHHWEVFNEPNLPGYGWLSNDEKADDYLGAYSLLLARANEAVRRNDPNGVVILGGIASDQHRGMPIEKAMAKIYGSGAKDCFDVMAFHPYGYQNKFPEARKRVDAVMADAGDGGKSVWFNEYGWTDYREMDEARNKSASTNPMMAVFAQRKSADALFWFSAKDYSSRRNAPTFGLTTFDLKKRPSFDTFRKLINEMN